jgi:hypothetical protein
VAVMLLTYMSGQPKSADFIVSTIAGAALLGVVFFPTKRGQDLLDIDPRLCGPHTSPLPISCSPTESLFGEKPVGVVHGVCAVVFIVCLAVIAIVFGYRARKEKSAVWRYSGYWVSGGIILAACVIALLDFNIGSLSSVYLGEVLALLSFGVAWFLNGEGFRFLLQRPHRGTR